MLQLGGKARVKTRPRGRSAVDAAEDLQRRAPRARRAPGSGRPHPRYRNATDVHGAVVVHVAPASVLRALPVRTRSGFVRIERERRDVPRRWHGVELPSGGSRPHWRERHHEGDYENEGWVRRMAPPVGRPSLASAPARGKRKPPPGTAPRLDSRCLSSRRAVVRGRWSPPSRAEGIAQPDRRGDARVQAEERAHEEGRRAAEPVSMDLQREPQNR